MISSTRSSSIACIAAATRSGCAISPCVSLPSPRSSGMTRRRRSSASGCLSWAGSLCGETMRNDAGERSASARIAASSGSPPTRSVAKEQRLAYDRLVRKDEDVRLAALLAHVLHDDVLERDVARDAADLVDEVLPQP